MSIRRSGTNDIPSLLGNILPYIRCEFRKQIIQRKRTALFNQRLLDAANWAQNVWQIVRSDHQIKKLSRLRARRSSRKLIFNASFLSYIFNVWIISVRNTADAHVAFEHLYLYKLAVLPAYFRGSCISPRL
ncbi:hypothetical protein D3C73_1192090 [compost metagenome]